CSSTSGAVPIPLPQTLHRQHGAARERRCRIVHHVSGLVEIRPASLRMVTDRAHKVLVAFAISSAVGRFAYVTEPPSADWEAIATSRPATPPTGLIPAAVHDSTCAHTASFMASRRSSSSGKPLGRV